MTQPYDWSKFSRRITIDASMELIYDTWTKQANLERWFLRKAQFTQANNITRHRNENVEKGDQYEWLWYGYPDSTVEHGTILEATGKDLFQFTFSGGCVVTVIFKREDGENICELWQDNFPADKTENIHLYIECGTGWTFYLANLKSILEGGIDLRNKNERLSNLVNS